MPSLNSKILELENQIKELQNQLKQLGDEVSATKLPGPTHASQSTTGRNLLVSDIDLGYGGTYAGKIIWNDAEFRFLTDLTSLTAATPTKGYCKHSHGDYSGGALDVNTLTFVEYEREGTNIKGKDGALPPHSQSYWGDKAIIKKANKYNSAQTHSLGGTIAQNVSSQVEKKGLLDLVFNANSGKWGCKAVDIDIKNCTFTEYDKDGVIVKDAKGNAKTAPLWNSDNTKTSIVWDENGQCWRLYAAFAPTPTT